MKTKIFTLIILAQLAFSFSGISQDSLNVNNSSSTTFQPHSFWIDGGIGSFYMSELGSGSIFGLSVCAGYNHLYRHFMGKVRYIFNQQISFSMYGGGAGEYNHSLSLNGGYVWTPGKLRISITSGIGIIYGARNGQFSTYYYRPAIPLEIELMTKTGRISTIGVSLYGNWNNTRPYVGLAFKLGLGKIGKSFSN